MFKKLNNLHTRRHHAKYQTIGHGPIYQGRFKSFPIEDEQALNYICNYVDKIPFERALLKGQKIGLGHLRGDSQGTDPL